MGTLLNRRRYMGGGSSLPYDAEIEYLESTGTQWIDLGFKATREIDIEISINRSTNSIRWDCGAEDGWSSKIARFIIINNDQAYWRFYNGGSSIVRSQDIVGDIRIIGNKYVGTIINETTGISYSRTVPSSQAFQTSENFLLFGYSYVTEPSVDATSSGARIYSAKVRDTGVNLDLIPVRVGTTGYLYDKVSGTLFGNAGTGSFTLGQDIVPIEYLESDGTQLINTGINGGTDCDYEVVFKAITGSANHRVFVGATLRENAMPKLYWYSQIQAQWWNGAGTITKTFGNVNTKYKVSYVDGSLYRDDVLLYTINTSGIGSKNFCAFGYLAESGTMSSKMQLYSLKLWKDGVLVRDMIPVRAGTIGYMLDKVSHTLFANAGTGDFILGNDL